MTLQTAGQEKLAKVLERFGTAPQFARPCPSKSPAATAVTSFPEAAATRSRKGRAKAFLPVRQYLSANHSVFQTVEDRSKTNDEQTRARFERLMLPLLKEAYNLARWLMSNEEDAQDAVQDSYLKAFRFFEGFHEEVNVRAWLLRIVRNTCYTAWGARNRKAKVVAREEIDAIEDAAPDPHATLATKAIVETVRDAIAALAVDYREVLVLRELEGLSYKEIAEVAGIPLGTVMSRLARARDQLRLTLRERKEHDQR